MSNFFDTYLAYTEETESPRVYHRWCAIAAIGALLGRNFYFPHGHFRVFPNLYCLLLGEPGARKSTAIKLAKKLLFAAGYESIAADKTTKEKFLVDLEGATEEEEFATLAKKRGYNAVTDYNLWGGSSESKTPRETFIMADEFNEFIGINNLDFITTLGNFWDWDDENRPFESRLKNSRSVSIWQPTISILGGNTPDNYAKAFPADIIGQGFLSRLLHIYGEDNGKRITFPTKPPDETTAEIVRFLQEIKLKVRGEATVTADATTMLDEIYKRWEPIPDVRFKSYSTRRFTQLLRICCIISASRLSTVIDEGAVVYANTILAAAEHAMPKALGEFGKSKHSDVANKIMEALNKARKPQNVKDLWKLVQKDLDKVAELSIVLQALEHADRIFLVPKQGWLSKGQKVRELLHVDWNLLTEDERHSF